MQANVYVTLDMVNEALDQLRGAVMIVYPMGLPPHDPIRMELENQEDLAGTQVEVFEFGFFKVTSVYDYESRIDLIFYLL